MQNKNKNYLFLVAIHIALGFMIFLEPLISVVYTYLILFIGIYFVVKTQNKNNEVLYVSGYIIGAEVFLRMTGGSASYEFGKYGLVCFSLLGMYYSGFSKKAAPYWIYLLLLIPGLILSAFVLNGDLSPRKLVILGNGMGKS